MARFIRAAIGILIVGLFIFAARSTQTLPLEKIKLPSGFSIKVYASGVPNARQMALGSNGVVFAGSREAATKGELTTKGTMKITKRHKKMSFVPFVDRPRFRWVYK